MIRICNESVFVSKVVQRICNEKICVALSLHLTYPNGEEKNMKNENKFLEFKSDKGKTYLKTVSAFANYGDGEIIFGIDDKGKTIGLADPSEFSLDIENQINDSISPRVDFEIRRNNDRTVSLLIHKGRHTPYFYNGKTYKRNDTSTIEVDEIELRRLYTEGSNETFDSLDGHTQKGLTFNHLEDYLKKEVNIEKFDLDTLKSLNLFAKGAYNNAALLLSDKNDFNGVDIAVFGNNISEIKERIPLGGLSLLEQFEESMKVFRRNYVYEEVNGGARKTVELIPEKAFKEAISNAIVHRLYDVNIPTKVAMYKDHIEINSPGGLPYGISKEDYVSGAYSVLRNPIIASVLNRLRIIESFATGIRRINEEYKEYTMKPTYRISDTSVCISLPITVIQTQVTSDQMLLMKSLSKNIKYTRKEIEEETNIGKDKVIRLINSLLTAGLMEKEGTGRSTVYFLKNR